MRRSPIPWQKAAVLSAVAALALILAPGHAAVAQEGGAQEQAGGGQATGAAGLTGLQGLSQPGAPLEIEADGGLELFQDRNLVVATGNVVARQGQVVLYADLLSASYQEKSGKRSIQRIDAVGSVRIETAREQLYGDHATYDLERSMMVVTGKDLRIEAPEQTIRADESLEFWDKENRAVARGNAVITQAETSLTAEVVEALLRERGKGSAETAPAAGAPSAQPVGALPVGGASAPAVERVRAWGRVIVRTATEVVEGDRGDYDVVKQVATLSGNVRIRRGRNQLNGEQAVVNLKTGVSRLVAGKSGRVRTILFPGGSDTVDPPAPQQGRGRAGTRAAVPIPKPRPQP